MKTKLLLCYFFVAFTSFSFAQIKVTEITANNRTHYITTIINYPVTGTYLFEGKSEPIVQLNPNGSGIFQLHEKPKSNMTWGFECSQIGIPKFKEGFNSAVYSLWYKNDNEENWNEVQFSIHFNKLKMFILGERIKSFTEEELNANNSNGQDKLK
ncbi:hypothetical protein [Flavobacterium agrisoli]|uniref:Uncharacterized protein n=1 Tax=Flavobacterium agrisoli TaxID=2793066 RepID=A0A934PMN4_9FLAO|nr:hypothetical protein [Flavobacterium agrisoli]MBK0370045.1 hypothetical protein [Flavobacterium agrisoli]